MPPRVLWLIKGLGLGGAERLLVSMAARIDRERFEVEVAYVLRSDDDFLSELRALEVRTTCLQGRGTLDVRWVRRLRQLLREGRYDLVHTHSPVPAVAARLLALPGTRFVHTEHNTWPSYARPTRVANAATYRRNRAAIAVSAAVAASIVPPVWLRPGRQPPVEVLHHGVDLTQVPSGARARATARAHLGVGDEVTVMGMVASFTDRKDQGGLIDALAQIRQRVGEVQLLLIGSGPTGAELRATVARHGLEEQVRFIEPRPDVLRLLPALDLFVLNSRIEGLPISLLEAMAAGVPAVVTRVGGVPEALTDGVEGRIVEPGDPAALAAALTELLLDPPRRTAMGEQAARRVATDFDIGAAVDRHEAIYDEVLK